MNENKKRRIALTVDVEAHPIRAAQDHVNCLIWGRQNSREAGIQTMMDIADKHGVPMTFFLDYPEYELYGEELLDVGREIHRRGHDLEPHCHAEYIIKPLFGLENEWAIRLPKATYEQSRKIVDYLITKHEMIAGQKPLAYRSGAYLIGPEYLKALYDGGIRLDASYNALSAENPFPWGLRGNFFWENGLWEIPIPSIPYFYKHNHIFPWNFNHAGFLRGTQEENLQKHKNFLDTWFKRSGDDSVATMVMHSWSFWKMDTSGHFTIPADENITQFEALITELKKDYEFVSLGDLAKKQPAKESLEVVSFSENTGYCPVCYEPASHFQDYNAPKRQCAFCKSVERQRTLVDLVYSGAFGPGIFNGKKVLHLAPGWAESLLLRRMNDCDVKTLNILPGSQIQADIQNMPEIADNSFDVVLASEVFRHVKNLDAGLKEISRVLKPGGILLASDCLENSDYGHEITDRTEQTIWYGEEKLKKYGIGDFRRFGRKDWPKAFEKYFYTRVFEATDKGTGSPAWWLAAVPKKNSDDSFSPDILASNAGRILHNPAIDPISDFLQNFENWDEWRKNDFHSDFAALRKVILGVNFCSEDTKFSDTAEPEWPKTYPSSYYPYVEQSWMHLLPDIAHDSDTGFSPQINHLVSEALRWMNAYGFYADSGKFDPHTRILIWDDTATASRLCILAYIFIRILHLKEISSEILEKIFRSMLDHFLLLCTSAFYIDRHNHGWLQMYALLGFCMALPFINGTAAASSLALERSDSLVQKLTSKEGMFKEHTLSYHLLAIVLLSRIQDLASNKPEHCDVLEAIEFHLEKMRLCASCLLIPAGEMAQFGDAGAPYPLIQPELDLTRKSASIPKTIVLKDAGYAVLRIPHAGLDDASSSWLAMAGAFHSLNHKHCDDLSFIWTEGKCSVLVDSGMQQGLEGLLWKGALWEKGFYYSAPNRVYVESAHAHNVVEINDETWSRRVKPWGALPLDARQLDEKHWLIVGKWERPEGFLQVRKLIFAPGRWLLVIDDLAGNGDQKEASFTQWLHLAPDLQLANSGDKRLEFVFADNRPLFVYNCYSSSTIISMHKGEIAPRLQGWVAQDPRTLIPAWALGIHARGRQASFATLFSLDHECLGCSIDADRISLKWARETEELDIHFGEAI